MIQIQTFQATKYTDLIERIWILENWEEEIEVLSPPDPYISLLIPLHGSLWKYNQKELRESLLEGISLQSSLATYPKDCKLLGIRFYPYGLIPFMDYRVSDLVNNTRSFDTHISDELSQLYSDEPILTDNLLRKIYELLDKLYCPLRYEKTRLVREFYQYFRFDNHTETIEEFSQQCGTNYTSFN